MTSKKSKYPVIYCSKKMRSRLEKIGASKGISGITPVLNHIVTNYERNQFVIQAERNNKRKRGKPKKFKGMEWF